LEEVTSSTSSQSPAASALPLTSKPEHREMVVVPIPEVLIGYVLGRKGSVINEIRTKSKASIRISGKVAGSHDRTITISGTVQANELAVKMIQAALLRARKPAASNT